MPVAEHLLEILRCPKSRGELIYFAAGAVEPDEFLFCPASKLRYRIEDGIPVMLLDEAVAVDREASEALTRKARELGLVD